MSAIGSVVVFSGDGVVREVGPDGVHQQGVRAARGDDALAARLGSLLRASASVFEGPGLPQPGDGTVVLCRSDGLHRLVLHGSGRLDHVVLLDAGRTRTLDQVETLGLAGAVERDPYADWSTGHATSEPAIVGRLDAAAAMGARLDSEPLTQGTRYGRFQLPGITDVVDLLARYLKTCCGTSPGGVR